MNYTDTITLTSKELAGAMSLCGYNSFVYQLISEKKLVSKKKKEVTIFAEDAEESLRSKGFWHARTETNLSKDLEDLMHAVGQSKKVIHCIRPGQELLIHQIDQSFSLRQFVDGEEHTFTYVDHRKGYKEELARFYQLNPASTRDLSEIEPIQVSGEIYNFLHELEKEEIELMLNNENENPAFKTFIDAFNKNGKLFNPLTFAETEYMDGKNIIDHVAFSVPGDDMVWHLEYEEVNDDKVYFVPVPVSDYFQKIEDTIYEFFGQVTTVTKPVSKPKKKASKSNSRKKTTPEPFSFKRGVSFFWRSNVVLLIMAIFLLINKGSWVGDGSGTLLLLVLVSEVMIMLLAFFSCFPKKESK
jgi:hypothetical protein